MSLSSSRRPTTVQLSFFDPHAASNEAWSRYHAYRRLRAAEDFPGEPVIGDADFEADLRADRPLFQVERIVAREEGEEGEVVGNLVLTFRRPSSPEADDYAAHIDFGGGVVAPSRRRGVARALLAGLVDFMAEHGKTIATAKVQTAEGHLCMEAIGADRKLGTVQNRLLLGGLDWDQLAQWSLPQHPRAAGLRWEVHAGRVPIDILAPLMAPMSALINQAPFGTLEQPRIRYQIEGYANWYAEMDRRGGAHLLVLLRDGDEVAAVCDASWDQRFPDRIHQALTAVAEPWRGLGLAKAVKARMLLLVRERLPQVQMVNTFNAHANAAMLSINQRLGFSVHKEESVYQVTRERLCAYLGLAQ